MFLLAVALSIESLESVGYQQGHPVLLQRSARADIADLTAWTNELIQDVDNATTMAPIEEEGPVPDSKLVGHQLCCQSHR